MTNCSKVLSKTLLKHFKSINRHFLLNNYARANTIYYIKKFSDGDMLENIVVKKGGIR